VYSTFFVVCDGPCFTQDYGLGLALHTAGNAYVTGTTYSSDFPTVNALQPTLAGYGDSFVAMLNAAGSALVYSTYLGGSSYEERGGSIAVDTAGNAYVTGITYSSDFPTVNALQPTLAGDIRNAFVAKIDPTTTQPPVASALSLNPASVTSGATSTGTVTLSAGAPTGGAAVTLSSSNTAVATVPPTVTVPAGAMSANFTVSTSAVAASTP